MVYLLHFDRPISDAHTCQHYLGWAKSLKKRITEHKAGTGARLTAVALERGISFEVVRTWPGGRALERQLKNRKNGHKLCPLCNKPSAPKTVS
jgi:predicted GIY-YIG superfamily endonuclease